MQPSLPPPAEQLEEQEIAGPVALAVITKEFQRRKLSAEITFN